MLVRSRLSLAERDHSNGLVATRSIETAKLRVLRNRSSLKVDWVWTWPPRFQLMIRLLQAAKHRAHTYLIHTMWSHRTWEEELVRERWIDMMHGNCLAKYIATWRYCATLFFNTWHSFDPGIDQDIIERRSSQKGGHPISQTSGWSTFSQMIDWTDSTKANPNLDYHAKNPSLDHQATTQN